MTITPSPDLPETAPDRSVTDAMRRGGLGKCPACGAWDTLEAVAADASADKDPHRGLAGDWSGDESNAHEPAHAPQAMPIANAGANDAPVTRLATGIG